MRRATSHIAAAIGVAAVSTVVLANTPSMRYAVVALNGIFTGSMVAITFAYSRLLWNALMGDARYDRARQMTIGIFLGWVAICMFILSSVYARAIDNDISATVFSAIARIIAITAAILQITAPDLGHGVLYGRDRKLMWVAIGAGLLMAAAVIYAQIFEILS